MLDPEVCERARQARDARFDGRFFIGVVTTGVYCRPVCPVRPPKAQNVRFYPSAAAAAEAGFRPCLRCRPEASPGTPAWRGTSATVSRALRLIESGALDDGSVESLAGRLGLGPRQLGRLFAQHLGASPRAVAQTRRLHFAKQLIDETELSMAQVALSSGFGSVRRFNDAVRQTYDRTPGELRRARRRPHASDAAGRWSLRMPYRAPLAWESLLAWQSVRAIPGVEHVSRDAYRRSISLGGKHGAIEVRHAASGEALQLDVRFPDAAALLQIAGRTRRLFDLDADVDEIEARLSADRRLASMVRAAPGLRVPGSWDGFELSVRAILGQQVSVRGATTLSGRLVQRFGLPLASAPEEGITHLFPTAEALCDADVASIGVPGGRADAIRALARAVAEGELEIGPGADPEVVSEKLTAIKGIGDWTAHYVAMRALCEPDAFPAGDLALRKAFSSNGKPCGERALAKRAEAWRPWRAYAALQIWNSLSQPSAQPSGRPSARTNEKPKRSAGRRTS